MSKIKYIFLIINHKITVPNLHLQPKSFLWGPNLNFRLPTWCPQKAWAEQGETVVLLGLEFAGLQLGTAGSPACWLRTLGLATLHSHTSQLLKSKAHSLYIIHGWKQSQHPIGCFSEPWLTVLWRTDGKGLWKKVSSVPGKGQAHTNLQVSCQMGSFLVVSAIVPNAEFFIQWACSMGRLFHSPLFCEMFLNQKSENQLFKKRHTKI